MIRRKTNRKRGGSNINTMKRRSARRRIAANVAQMAQEESNKAIYQYTKLQDQIVQLQRDQHSDFDVKQTVLEIIKLSERGKKSGKHVVLLRDYLIGEFDVRLVNTIKQIAESMYRHAQHDQSYINLKKDLLQQMMTYANKLSNNTKRALEVSSKTHLSNLPNEMTDEEANEIMRQTQLKTKHNLELRPSSATSNSVPDILLERIKISIQIAQEMERITYNSVSKKTSNVPLSLQKRTILKENDIYVMLPLVGSHDIYSNRIRAILGIESDLKMNPPDINALFQWLLDATDLAWQDAAINTKEYMKHVHPSQLPIIECNLYHLYCQKGIYNLSIRHPVMKYHYPKADPLFNLQIISKIKEYLTNWERVERSLLSTLPIDSPQRIPLNRKRMERLEIIEWLDKHTEHNSKNAFFATYQDELKMMRQQKGTVAELVRYHTDAIASATPKPSTAPTPSTTRSTVSKPSTAPPKSKFNPSLYAERVGRQLSSGNLSS